MRNEKIEAVVEFFNSTGRYRVNDTHIGIGARFIHRDGTDSTFRFRILCDQWGYYHIDCESNMRYFCKLEDLDPESSKSDLLAWVAHSHDLIMQIAEGVDAFAAINRNAPDPGYLRRYKINALTESDEHTT